MDSEICNLERLGDTEHDIGGMHETLVEQHNLAIRENCSCRNNRPAALIEALKKNR